MLELCSKTGLVSASVQTKGYFKVDVLNENMPTLRTLQRNNLYRNYIWREVSGIGSTGLREESYDVVVTSGGFSSHAMSPNDITEVSSDFNLNALKLMLMEMLLPYDPLH